MRLPSLCASGHLQQGHPENNAHMESLFRSLKREFVHGALHALSVSQTR